MHHEKHNEFRRRGPASDPPPRRDVRQVSAGVRPHLAAKVDVDPKTAARWLADGRIPRPRTRIAVAAVLGCDAADLWPEPLRRRDLAWFRPWVELEQEATSFRSYQPLLVPGLLQTEEYARAMLRTGNLLPPAEVAREQHVQLRIVLAESPWHTGLAGPFVLARMPDHREVAYLDNQLRGELVTEKEGVATLGSRWESITGEALGCRRSVELIEQVAQAWS